jgi:DNA-binding transcriptional MocR family regulator
MSKLAVSFLLLPLLSVTTGTLTAFPLSVSQPKLEDFPKIELLPRSLQLKSTTSAQANLSKQKTPRNRRLQSAAIIRDLRSGGQGELTVINGTNRDAVVVVLNTQAGGLLVAFYVRAGDTVIMPDISDGLHRIVFGQGIDWDSKKRDFTRNVSFSAFERLFRFKTIQKKQQIQLTKAKISLNPIAGGTGKVKPLSAAEFRRLLQKKPPSKKTG